MAPLLVIRADADVAIGSGHVMRCLALAREWQERGGKAVFWGRISAGPLRARIVAEGCQLHLLSASHPDPADCAAVLVWQREAHEQSGWVVLDGYHFSADYHDAIRASGWPLLVIDDYGHLPEYHADILLNPNAYAGELTYNTGVETLRLLGARYALLRREFRVAREENRIAAPRGHRILVTMGGADQNNVCGRVVDALLAMDRSDLEVKIVSGSLNPHHQDLVKRLEKAPFDAELMVTVTEMAPLMQWADLAISAAGSTCWELAAMGVPMLVTVLADNQERVAAYLEAHGAAINLGWFDGWQANQVADVLEVLLADQEQRGRMAGNGQGVVDGMGCGRVVEMMLSTR
ncbi:MAG: UDP-2,4-diacetamido-2,4,6-trideoxy-beta-L-altropyranose hydrolase [Desulfurivibrionaceae bacterium]